MLLLAVCGKVAAAASPYQDIPPGILYPSVPVPPIVGAPSGPAPIGYSKEVVGGRRKLTAPSVNNLQVSANASALESTLSGEEAPVTSQALCVGTGNPVYTQVAPSLTHCQLVVFTKTSADPFGLCVATFIRPNMVVTAASCIIERPQEYDIQPDNPGTCVHYACHLATDLF